MMQFLYIFVQAVCVAYFLRLCNTSESSDTYVYKYTESRLSFLR